MNIRTLGQSQFRIWVYREGDLCSTALRERKQLWCPPTYSCCSQSCSVVKTFTDYQRVCSLVYMIAHNANCESNSKQIQKWRWDKCSGQIVGWPRLHAINLVALAILRLLSTPKTSTMHFWLYIFQAGS